LASPDSQRSIIARPNVTGRLLARVIHSSMAALPLWRRSTDENFVKCFWLSTRTQGETISCRDYRLPYQVSEYGEEFIN
jgi:hypothetical protein